MWDWSFLTTSFSLSSVGLGCFLLQDTSCILSQIVFCVNISSFQIITCMRTWTSALHKLCEPTAPNARPYAFAQFLLNEWEIQYHLTTWDRHISQSFGGAFLYYVFQYLARGFTVSGLFNFACSKKKKFNITHLVWHEWEMLSIKKSLLGVHVSLAKRIYIDILITQDHNYQYQWFPFKAT